MLAACTEAEAEAISHGRPNNSVVTITLTDCDSSLVHGRLVSQYTTIKTQYHIRRAAACISFTRYRSASSLLHRESKKTRPTPPTRVCDITASAVGRFSVFSLPHFPNILQQNIIKHPT